jgi:FAD/FMN-containing dehydrogenase
MLNRLNRVLSFDPQTAVLECESGVSLAEIIHFFLPRGFFLPVTPGTKFVTVGGAIASDIHGKNHHRDGTLANFILDFKLLTPGGEVLLCSPTANRDVFWATCGGMGLTGVILSAAVRLQRVESSYVLVDLQKTENFDDAFGLMGESDDQYQYSVAWVDCLAKGKSTGRSLLIRGNHAATADLPPSLVNPFPVPAGPRLSVPFDLPAIGLNRLTVRLLNALYYRRHATRMQQLVALDSFFYPLDAIGDWNRMYGRRGFVQYQVVLPLENARDGLLALLEKLRQSSRAPFLAVMKRFGEANPGLLSFPMKGWTLAMDLPVTGGLVEVLHDLDKLVLDYGGRVYLAKDAVLKAESFAAMYPKLDEFREIKKKIDPQGVLSSSMARRLGVVKG